jgi:hypothetical protein
VVDESIVVETAGFKFTCGEVDVGGRQGDIPADSCGALQEQIKTKCLCKELPESNRTANDSGSLVNQWNATNGLFKFKENDVGGIPAHQEYQQPPYAPLTSVATRSKIQKPVLFNALSDPVMRPALTAVMFNERPAISEMVSRNTAYHHYTGTFLGEQSSYLYYPVFSRKSESKRLVGAIGLEYIWAQFVTGILLSKSDLLALVIENSCGQSHTYAINPRENLLELKGTRDLHDAKYEHMMHSTSFDEYDALFRTGGSLAAAAEDCLCISTTIRTVCT